MNKLIARAWGGRGGMAFRSGTADQGVAVAITEGPRGVRVRTATDHAGRVRFDIRVEDGHSFSDRPLGSVVQGDDGRLAFTPAGGEGAAA